jgi:hypothetical protein
MQWHRFTILTAFYLISCNPIYSTYYEYQPLKSQQSKQCVVSCQNEATRCTQRAQVVQQVCEARAEVAYQGCLASKVFGYDANGNFGCLANCYCWKESCGAPDYEPCNTAHRSCYVACGGQIIARTSCIRNCDEASGPTTTILGEQKSVARTSKVVSKKAEEPKSNVENDLKEVLSSMKAATE